MSEVLGDRNDILYFVVCLKYRVREMLPCNGMCVCGIQGDGNIIV